LTSSPRGSIILHIRRSNGASTSSQDLASLRVALVDDHELFRRGLHDLLSERGLEVVGEASDGEEAVRLAAGAIPDVVLMDVSMPGMGGVEATRRIREATPHTRIVMLTVSADEEDVNEAILAGASGYLLKDSPIEVIVSGIAAASRGEALLSPAIAGNLLAKIGASEAAGEASSTARLRLTDRERDVLELMAAGKENPQIAEELFISVQTVKNHVSNILAKLEVENRIQAAVYAVRRGLA
jgi:DNA-binding NarL/FixJ family response regulator